MQEFVGYRLKKGINNPYDLIDELKTIFEVIKNDVKVRDN